MEHRLHSARGERLHTRAAGSDQPRGFSLPGFREQHGARPQARPIGRDVGEHLYRPPMISLPELLEDAWARALPGRQAAAQNEVVRAFRPCPPSGKPDIETDTAK